MKPTVTELCDLINKPALINWSNKLGLQGISLEEYQKKVKKEGINLHSEIENYFKSGEKIKNPEINKKVEILFSNAYNIQSEVSFENNLYRGRCDIMYEINGKKIILDFKRNFKKFYINNYIQLICYKWNFDADRVGILNLNTMDISMLNPKYDNDVKKLIENLCSVYELLKKIK